MIPTEQLASILKDPILRYLYDLMKPSVQQAFTQNSGEGLVPPVIFNQLAAEFAMLGVEFSDAYVIIMAQDCGKAIARAYGDNEQFPDNIGVCLMSQSDAAERESQLTALTQIEISEDKRPLPFIMQQQLQSFYEIIPHQNTDGLNSSAYDLVCYFVRPEVINRTSLDYLSDTYARLHPVRDNIVN